MTSPTTAPSDLNVRLGHAADARVLIVNADDFGMCRSANEGIRSLLAAGAISSTTLMTTCPWAPEALAFAAAHPQHDVGLHLVFTSEWEGYRWGPVGDARASLVDADGYLPRDCRTFELTAAEDDVVAEMRAQLARMRAAGVEPSHADNHMGSLYGLETGRDLLPAVLALCAAEGLPFRLPRSPELRGIDVPDLLQPLVGQLIAARSALADALGVVIPDRLWTHAFETLPGEDYERARDTFVAGLRDLRPGVTEYYLHPFTLSDELRAISPDAAKRAWELDMLRDPVVHDVIAEEGILLARWRDLQELQRADRAARLASSDAE